jgi:hypothetical protein
MLSELSQPRAASSRSPTSQVRDQSDRTRELCIRAAAACSGAKHTRTLLCCSRHVVALSSLSLSTRARCSAHVPWSLLLPLSCLSPASLLPLSSLSPPSLLPLPLPLSCHSAGLSHEYDSHDDRSDDGETHAWSGVSTLDLELEAEIDASCELVPEIDSSSADGDVDAALPPSGARRGTRPPNHQTPEHCGPLT